MKIKSGFVLVIAIILIASSQYTGYVEAEMSQTEDLVFDPVSIMIAMDENGTSLVRFHARVINHGSATATGIDIRFDSVQAELLSAEFDGEGTDATLQSMERYSLITFNFANQLNENEAAWITVTLSINDIQSDSGLILEEDATLSDFIFYVRPLHTYSNFTLTAILPPKSTLSGQSVTPIFPKSSENFTDGLSLAFIWNVSTLQPGQERVFIVRYQSPIYSGIPVAFAQGEIIVLSIAFLILGLLIGLYGPRIIIKLKDISRVRIAGVTSEEEQVLDAIRAKGGSCLQKDLYVDLDMSQSKVSLILTALEERGLVRRFKDGRENTVHIIEE
ncbi:MAG: helix-turn-helix transcriptional regulator [Candidatus Thorarchaeota archaeon]